MIFNMVGGGGGSSTKSTIIVSIETGSTVAAYSDSSYQTLVKTASEKSTGEYWLTGLDNGTYYIKATKGSDEATTSYTITEYGVYRITMSYSTIPEFTYTGDYEIVDDSDTPIVTSFDNWKIRFLTSGVLNFSQLNGESNGIDVFLVGGGGGGGASGGNSRGGGGGYTTTSTVTISTGTDYAIEVGGGSLTATGNASTAFGLTANGGEASSSGADGGSGGGGAYRGGGSDGADGIDYSGSAGGAGQHTTTREFGGYTNTVLNSVSSSTTFVLGTTPTTVEQAFLVSGKYLTIGSNRSATSGNDKVYPISAYDASTNTVTLSSAITATAGEVVMFGNLYSGGGGGGANSVVSPGGYGGGGAGGKGSTAGEAGTANTGGGGGGAASGANGGTGGSGIIIIRNKRS